jgi:hypothetical protein
MVRSAPLSDAAGVSARQGGVVVWMLLATGTFAQTKGGDGMVRKDYNVDDIAAQECEFNMLGL